MEDKTSPLAPTKKSIFGTANNSGLPPDVQKQLKMRAVHPDELKELKQFQPWQVTLYIQQTANAESGLNPRVYFVRQSNAGDAATLATQLWTRWEKPGGNDMWAPPYPTFEARAGMMFIDDNDYLNAWKVAQKMPGVKYIGQKLNPMAFTYDNSQEIEVLIWDQDKVPWAPKHKKNKRK